ncbi:hypothetical protein BC936DRAFT_149326 [Jimgerdemannia flammicorona]|uniref:Uncharacterized protein n=1 Tax=Jimgerdemannia flammicorona TaxID=994334 RepID=A0A433DK02_9FUNG|nr:hypothetical protein BC936DRAFT_149326 [Jimgerdemannia flammicorona]
MRFVSRARYNLLSWLQYSARATSQPFPARGFFQLRNSLGKPLLVHKWLEPCHKTEETASSSISHKQNQLTPRAKIHNSQYLPCTWFRSESSSVLVGFPEIFTATGLEQLYQSPLALRIIPRRMHMPKIIPTEPARHIRD